MSNTNFLDLHAKAAEAVAGGATEAVVRAQIAKDIGGDPAGALALAEAAVKGDPAAFGKVSAGEPAFRVLSKSADEFVIYGPASVAIVDREDDLITGPALKKALPQLLLRARVSLQHLDVLVGEIMAKWSDGKTDYATEVRPVTEADLKKFDRLRKADVEVGTDALFIVAKIYDDTKYCQETRDKLLKGELNALSLSGQAVSESAKSVCEGFTCKFVNTITDVHLSAVTLCTEGMNSGAGAEVIQKNYVVLHKSMLKAHREQCGCPKNRDLIKRLDNVINKLTPREHIVRKLEYLIQKTGEWVPHQGARGGRGAKNTRTGKVVYGAKGEALLQGATAPTEEGAPEAMMGEEEGLPPTSPTLEEDRFGNYTLTLSSGETRYLQGDDADRVREGIGAFGGDVDAWLDAQAGEYEADANPFLPEAEPDPTMDDTDIEGSESPEDMEMGEGYDEEPTSEAGGEPTREDYEQGVVEEPDEPFSRPEDVDPETGEPLDVTEKEPYLSGDPGESGLGPKPGTPEFDEDFNQQVEGAEQAAIEPGVPGEEGRPRDPNFGEGLELGAGVQPDPEARQLIGEAAEGDPGEAGEVAAGVESEADQTTSWLAQNKSLENLSQMQAMLNEQLETAYTQRDEGSLARIRGRLKNVGDAIDRQQFGDWAKSSDVVVKLSGLLKQQEHFGSQGIGTVDKKGKFRPGMPKPAKVPDVAKLLEELKKATPPEDGEETEIPLGYPQKPSHAQPVASGYTETLDTKKPAKDTKHYVHPAGSDRGEDSPNKDSDRGTQPRGFVTDQDVKKALSEAVKKENYHTPSKDYEPMEDSKYAKPAKKTDVDGGERPSEGVEDELDKLCKAVLPRPKVGGRGVPTRGGAGPGEAPAAPPVRMGMAGGESGGEDPAKPGGAMRKPGAPGAADKLAGAAQRTLTSGETTTESGAGAQAAAGEAMGALRQVPRKVGFGKMADDDKVIEDDELIQKPTGDLAEGGKKVHEEVYEKERKEGSSKEKSAKIAWGAVKNAGYTPAGDKSKGRHSEEFNFIAKELGNHELALMVLGNDYHHEYTPNCGECWEIVKTLRDPRAYFSAADDYFTKGVLHFGLIGPNENERLMTIIKSSQEE